MRDDVLIIIPARGGSKGIPHKNIKMLNGKPLIYYAIDTARAITSDENICVSTDDIEIKSVVESYGLKVPFLRPVELSTDTAGTYEVLIHAVDYHEKLGKHYDKVLLLQTTSPFRTAEQVKEALQLFDKVNADMVVSVKECPVNPYYNVFEEDKDGYLHISKGAGNIFRRQDAPKVYEYNGAIYIMDAKTLKNTHMHHMVKRVKYIMNAQSSMDLDTMQDWNMAEMIIKNENDRRL
jgi:N-acylneuraminate cytidylyltransferase